MNDFDRPAIQNRRDGKAEIRFSAHSVKPGHRKFWKHLKNRHTRRYLEAQTKDLINRINHTRSP